MSNHDITATSSNHHEKRIFIVIPVYNEGDRIREVLKRIKRIIPNVQVILVDDGSQDSTTQMVVQEYPHIKIIEHDINLGKGAALRTGCEAAVYLSADLIVVMDGDGQHKAEDVPRLLDALDRGSFDIVFGRRRRSSTMPLVFRIGNSFLTSSIRLFFNIFIQDTQSGFRAFTREAYEKIRWEASDYSVETEMIIRAGKSNLRYAEIEIPTIYLDKYKGTTPSDGLKIFFRMILWKFLWLVGYKF